LKILRHFQLRRGVGRCRDDIAQSDKQSSQHRERSHGPLPTERQTAIHTLTDNRHKRFLEGYGKAAQAMRVRLGAITAALDRGYGKPAQAVAIKGDPDSPVIFNLRLGDGMKTIDDGAVEVPGWRSLRTPGEKPSPDYREPSRAARSPK